MRSRSLAQMLADADQFRDRQAQRRLAVEIGAFEGERQFANEERARERLAAFGPDIGSDLDTPPHFADHVAPPCVDEPLCMAGQGRDSRDMTTQGAIARGLVGFAIGSVLVLLAFYAVGRAI